ncbi:hypothetical protein P7K49_008420 [Saguinus oedipus]|uniref:Uncharacterized protein n=1 Tax=Saguinus oedipus TaxID=9490 RepID=A0ABQ9VXN9_SAGOE|nr:hypothetical protein P7K49_008420 [Saguinus oedipus]
MPLKSTKTKRYSGPSLADGRYGMPPLVCGGNDDTVTRQGPFPQIEHCAAPKLPCSISSEPQGSFVGRKNGIGKVGQVYS